MSTPIRTSPPAFRRDRLVHGWLVTKGISDAGDAAWTIALAWSAVQLADPALAGLIVAAGTIPRAAILLFGGVIADRFTTFAVMRAVTVARLVVLAAAITALLTVGPSVPLLFAVAIGFGASDAVFEPSSITVSRQLVRADDLTSYASVSQLSTRFGIMAGGALGGVLVAAGGLLAVAVLNAATYLAVLAYLFVLRPRFALERAVSAPVFRSVADSFAHLRREPATRRLVLTLSGLNLAVVPALGIGLALRADSQGWGAESLGGLQALVGLGAVGGAVTLLRRRPRNEAMTGFALLVAQGLAITALAISDPAVNAVSCLVIGATSGAASALLSALFQRTVAGNYLGRLAAIQRMGDDVLMPAAMVSFGAVAAGASLAWAFALFGGAMTVLTLAITVSERATTSPD